MSAFARCGYWHLADASWDAPAWCRCTLVPGHPHTTHRCLCGYWEQCDTDGCGMREAHPGGHRPEVTS